MRKVIFVCGVLCSGKSTFCSDKHAHCGWPLPISVSDIVRSISKAETRKDLQATANLAPQIALELFKAIITQFDVGQDLVVVDGVRQLEILGEVSHHLHSIRIATEVIWIQADPTVLRARYMTLQASNPAKYGEPFEEALKRDMDLGLGHLEAVIKSNITIIA